MALHELAEADAVYTIYYDETNNIRRLHTRADGLSGGRIRKPSQLTNDLPDAVRCLRHFKLRTNEKCTYLVR